MSKRHVLILLLFILSSAIYFQACTKEEQRDTTHFNFADLPYETLAEYDFFEGNIVNLEPVSDVLPYKINTPLFSDYAQKARFIYIPKGSAAVYNGEDIFDFPVGTTIIKTFYYNHDFRDETKGRRIIETRLLIRLEDEWDSHSYLWNDEQTAATFSLVGRQTQVEWIHYDGTTRSTNYLIPNKNECKDCHKKDSVLVPIGPKALNINSNYDYADGTMNQLDKWAAMGYLSNNPNSADAPKTPLWSDPNSGTLNERARAYLDTNCGHCHNPGGDADNSGLSLYYHDENLTALGVCKPPVAAGGGSGGFAYAIVPGQPEESIMPFRMNSVELDVAMPELARSVVHEEGVALIKEWIASMDGPDCL